MTASIWAATAGSTDGVGVCGANVHAQGVGETPADDGGWVPGTTCGVGDGVSVPELGAGVCPCAAVGAGGRVDDGSEGEGLTLVHALAASNAANMNTAPRRREVPIARDICELWTRSIDVCFFTVCRLVASRDRRIFRLSGTAKLRFLFPLPPSERGAPIGQAPLVSFVAATIR